MLGAMGVYVWDFYGNGKDTLWTTENTVTYRYVYDPDLFIIKPSVRIKRGDILSNPSGNMDIVFVWPADDPAVDSCGQDSVAIANVRLPGSSVVPQLRGNTLILPHESGRYTVKAFDVSGREAAVLRTVGATVRLPVQTRAPGHYAIQVYKAGKRIASLRTTVSGR